MSLEVVDVGIGTVDTDIGVGTVEITLQPETENARNRHKAM
jgi:hypothetical protein